MSSPRRSSSAPDGSANASEDDAAADLTHARARREARSRSPVVRFLMYVLWPAFGGAAVSVGVIFSILDPVAVEAVRDRLGNSREGAYTIAFLALWALHALACALTWLLMRDARY